MGSATKAFVGGVFAVLMLTSLNAVLGRSWGVAAGFAVLAGFVAFIGMSGMFAASLKVPPESDESATDSFAAARLLARHNPGWRGKLLVIGVPASYALLLAIALWRMFR